jgi:hypothetical protein
MTGLCPLVGLDRPARLCAILCRMANDEKIQKLVRETKRQAGRMSAEDAGRSRRASEERVREAATRLPGGSANMPATVPDNLISSGEDE